MQEAPGYTLRMDFYNDTELCTVIFVNFLEQRIAIENHTDDLIHRAFGILEKPTWEDFEWFLQERCFPKTRDHLDVVLGDLGLPFYDPLAIIEKTGGRMAEDAGWLALRYLAEGE